MALPAGAGQPEQVAAARPSGVSGLPATSVVTTEVLLASPRVTTAEVSGRADRNLGNRKRSGIRLFRSIVEP